MCPAYLELSSPSWVDFPIFIETMELFPAFSSMELKKIFFFYQITNCTTESVEHDLLFRRKKRDFIYVAFVKLRWKDSMKE